MRLNEITKTDPKYWKSRYINRLDPEGKPPDHPTEEMAEERFAKVLPLLKKHCKEIIRTYRKAGRVLNRGARGRGKDIFVAGIRPDRRPGYLEKEMHQAEAIAVKKLGGVANRTNSIFCTNNVAIARDWGDDVYVVFPKDGWSVTFFPKLNYGYVYDELTYLEAAYHDAKNDGEFNGKKDPGKLAHDATMVMKLYRRLGVNFKKSQLPGFIMKKQNLEVLISGNSYIALERAKYLPLINKYLLGK